MQFFEISIKLNNKEVPEEENNIKELVNVFIDYSERIADRGHFFLVDVKRTGYKCAMITRGGVNVDKFVNEIIEKEHISASEVKISETTFHDFSRKIRRAERFDYFDYEWYELLEEYGIDSLSSYGPGGPSYSEYILKVREKNAIYLLAKNYFLKESLMSELDRIYCGKRIQQQVGHPVHYLIETDDEGNRLGVSKLLIQSLYNVGRLNNKRYTEIDSNNISSRDIPVLNALYDCNAYGAVIVNLNMYTEDCGGYASRDHELLSVIGGIIKKHCRDVLTIVCFPKECTKLKKMLYEYVGNVAFVELKEELVADEKAIEFLKKIAKECKVRTDKKLIASVEKGKSYTSSELDSIFDEWYSTKLKTTIYSQYKDIEGAKSKVKVEKKKGNAYDELNSMIGLDSAKTIINQALDSCKAQVMFREKGISRDDMCNHMIFTGNPGTAKTTVARLFAKILRENEVLSMGHIVEVGRGDLVGKYVGWTAPTIKKKFKEARGGILFIDEAYSLVDDRDGMYGDEAINTIVQEMENNRDEVIVIFAGYPDKMEKFLNKNPGLRSRIAHHVHFEDYNVEELCQIAEHIATNSGLILDDGAKKKIATIMEDACKISDFGNGRYARNVIEKARLAQSSRLVKMNYDDVTIDDVKTICADDIIIPEKRNETIVHHIGFAV